LLAMLLVFYSATAWAQEASRAVTKIVVAYSSGTTMDVSARILANALQGELGGVFIVENKPGGAGRIGAEYVARSKPDGLTLFISGNSTHSANPSLYKQLNYDPVKDFTAIARIATFPYILVTSPNKPFKTYRDFIKSAQNSSGKLNYGYGSPAARVATMTLARTERFDAVGVPYQGQPPAITDLLSGQIDFLITDLAVAVPHIKGGSLVALALLADTRSKSIPDVPTVQESGSPRFSLTAWMGVSGPAGMPPEITARLSTAINKILTEPHLQEQLEKLGMQVSPTDPSQFQNFVRSQLAVWTENVRAAGIQPE
jgi:tripartite-type tricarboxylate transporter receptor subunit TctC